MLAKSNNRGACKRILHDRKSQITCNLRQSFIFYVKITKLTSHTSQLLQVSFAFLLDIQRMIECFEGNIAPGGKETQGTNAIIKVILVTHKETNSVK